MSLADFWFVLFVAIIGAYIVLDGFDLGVGMLHPFAAKEDRERRIVLNSIGPIWDGNEVWLVVGVACCSRRSRWCTPRCSPGSTGR